MLVPADIEFTPDGPHTARYQDRYFGKIGALEQARKVFIQGCGIPGVWKDKKSFRILETGFGLGFNFLATWDAWKRDPSRPDQLHFLSIECHPIALQQLAHAHALEPELAVLARQLRLNLPPAIPGCHRLEFEQGQVCLTLAYESDERALKMLSGRVDAIYLDGFSPDRNPKLWSQSIIDLLFERSQSGTRLSTWCAASEIRRRLSQAGYEVQRGPGIGSKRETTQALCREHSYRSKNHEPNDSHPEHSQKNVIILGAGLAGTAITQRLVQRGWEVTLIDSGSGPAQGASGNTSGVVRPLVSRDDNRSSQFTRAALLYAIQRWERFRSSSHPAWHRNGVLQIARDEAQFQQWIRMIQDTPMPGEWMQILSQQEASTRCGHTVPFGGLLFPLAGWAEPKALCELAISEVSKPIRKIWNQHVFALKKEGMEDAEWLIFDQDEKEIARATHVVIATGAGPQIQNAIQTSGAKERLNQSNYFLSSRFAPLQRLRGEITQFYPHPQLNLDLVVCGEGYVCPSPDGTWSIGATYDAHHSLSITQNAVQENAKKLKELIGINITESEIRGGRAGIRSVSIDRLPLIGQDPEHTGIWHCRALASRGLAWHPLSAELLVAQMNGEPLPLSATLAQAVSLNRQNLLKKED